MKLLNTLLKYFTLVIIITSCEKDIIIEQEIFIDNPVAEEPIKTEPKKNYLALGDSYTIGESVISDDSFPYILVSELSKKDVYFDKPTVIAQTGWTTSNLLLGIERERLTTKYDFVTLLIGVNNQYQGKSIDIFKKEYIQLLNQAIYFANNIPNNVVVLSIPDWGVSPYAINFNVDFKKVSAEIDAFNSIKKEETLKLGVQFINITDICRLAKGDNQYFARDGLHFSKNMHQLWVYELLKFKTF